MRSVPSWLALLALLCTARAASAYQCATVTGQTLSLYWDERHLTYTVNERGYSEADIFPAVRASFATWSAVDCSDIVFEELEPSAAVLAGYDWHHPDDNENLIIWRRGNPGVAIDAWRHEPGSLAVTTTTFSSQTGELFDADIEFNAVNFCFTASETIDPACTDAYDVQNTATHEIGHVLGLAHPLYGQPGASSTTMYYRASSCETSKRDLDSDDIDGLCHIYPAGEPPQYCYTALPAQGPELLISEATCPLPGCCCAHSGAVPLASLGLWGLVLARIVTALRRGKRYDTPAEQRRR